MFSVLGITGLAIAIALAFRRIREIDRRVSDGTPAESSIFRMVGELDARVSRLEALAPAASPPAVPAVGPRENSGTASEAAQQRPEIVTKAAALAPSVPQLSASTSAERPAPGRSLVRENKSAAPRPLAMFVRSVLDRLRSQIASDEWEAIVGGSWLNKAGVLVLVIGISLFLGQTLAYRGPMARIATGLFASLAMLAGGVMTERRSRYVVAGRGLIGGGWAALYTTAYAAYGFQSARIVHSPSVATMLICIVAAGMIAHSIRYRSEVVTGLAYFVGFFTLVLGPMTEFVLVASVPLVASMLYLSRRYRWESLAVSGLVFTYLSYVWSFPSSVPSRAFFVGGQIALAGYWMMFEGFDLAELIDGKRRGGAQQALAAINATGFIGIALMQWLQDSPSEIHIFLFYAAAFFALSAALRWKLGLRASPAPRMPSLDLFAIGGFEGSLTVAAALMAGGLLHRFTGAAGDLALLAEAEVLFLFGIRLGQPYVQALGGAVFAITAAKVLAQEPSSADTLVMFQHAFLVCTPAAIVTAATGYINRVAYKGWRLYGWASSLIVCVVLGFELNPAYVGLGWMIVGACLAEYGRAWRDSDLRDQGYISATAGFGFLTILNGGGFPEIANPHPIFSLGPAAAMAFGATYRMMRTADDSVFTRERLTLRDAASAAGTILTILLLWQTLPATAVAVGWMGLAVLLIEAGIVCKLPALRAQGYAAALATCVRLYMANFDTPDYAGILSYRLLTVTPVIASFYYLALRFREESESSPIQEIEPHAASMCLRIGALLIVTLIRFEAGRVNAVIGWALFALILLLAGLRTQNRDLRLQSCSVAVAAFLRSWATNFVIPGSLGGMPQRVATGAFVIACLYACQLLAPRTEAVSGRPHDDPLQALVSQVDANARRLYSLLASALLAMLLFCEISGNLLTVAWGVEALALLIAGFALRERVLRHSGLALFGLCLLKVFGYDLNELTAMPRMASFIGLGAMLIGISFVYSRYQEQLRRYL
ncbi:MAG TPA: DUF2339 domain-containing protein [Candidatus Binataceae bacterium]|nr:DUF2339 domain-containing protein [Candidatus Binataceae bacterium]